MKTGYKKFTATGEFNDLQSLRWGIEEMFYVQNVKWCGNWNGMNWSNFSFYCTKDTLTSIIAFCNENNLQITYETTNR